MRSWQEGVFGALALMPLFMAKLPTGLLGGYLLQQYCPGPEGGGCPRGWNEADANATAAEEAATLLAHHPTCDGRMLWAGTSIWCPPRHRYAFQPLLLETRPVTRRAMSAMHLPATSSTIILNPPCLNHMASYDVASSICPWC